MKHWPILLKQTQNIFGVIHESWPHTVTDSVMLKSKLIDSLRTVVSASATCTNRQYHCISPARYFKKGLILILLTHNVNAIPAIVL
jgi:hypothetical protein